MARRAKDGDKNPSSPSLVTGAPLEPIGVVERDLTLPDGTTVTVEVPVYPPFRLEDHKTRAPVRQRGRLVPKPVKSAESGSGKA